MISARTGVPRAVLLILPLLTISSPSIAGAQTDPAAGCSSPSDGSNRSGLDTFLAGLGSIFNFARSNGSSVEVTTATPGTAGSPRIERKDKFEVVDAGCGMTTASYASQAAIAPQIDGGRGPVRGGATARVGVASNLEITLPNARWNEVLAAPTDAPLPNPFDPSTLPPGSTVVLRRETFASLELEAAYRALIVKSEVMTSDGNVVSVTRTEDGKIRLAVGPYQAVKNEAFIGFGTSSIRAGLANTKRLENGTVRSWEFDPSNPEDLAAFQRALTTGVVTGGANGGNRPTETVQYIDLKDSTALKAELGPIAIDTTLLASSGSLKVTTHADGSKTVEGVSTYGNETVSVVRNYDPQGTLVGSPRFDIRFKGISDWNAEMLSIATGQPKPSGNATLTLQGDEWMVYRDRAKAYIARYGSISPFLDRLANAQKPEDVAIAIYQSARQYTFTFEELERLTRDLNDPRKDGPRLPGALQTTPCPGA